MYWILFLLSVLFISIIPALGIIKLLQIDSASYDPPKKKGCGCGA